MSEIEFNWSACYENRRKRLAKLLSLDAPEIIVQRETQMLLVAISKGKYRAIFDWLRDQMHHDLSMKWFECQLWYWRKVRRRSEKLIGRRMGWEQ